MKIVFVTTGNISNLATAKRALGLANPLSNIGWSVYIIMEDNPDNRYRAKLECDNRVRLLYFKSGSLIKELKEKNKILKDYNFDYIYICAFVPRNIVGINSKAVKLVEHSELQSQISDFRYKRLLCYLYELYSIFYSDGLLNASNYLQSVYQNRAKHLFNKNLPMMYFPYAYNKQIVKPIQKKKKDNNVTFLFLGSIHKNYGVFTILEAAQILSEIYDNFVLYFIGKGKHFDDAAKYIESHSLQNYVKMAGYVKEENLSDYLNKADCFISPMKNNIQDWARCPSKIYLYLPFRKPIITCKIGDPYDLLGSNALYYEPENPEDLSMAMIKVMRRQFKTTNMDIEIHSWDYRAKCLNEWINQNYIR